MKKLLMFVARTWPESRIGRWAYMKCMRLYMRDGGDGYFKFAADYCGFGEK